VLGGHVDRLRRPAFDHLGIDAGALGHRLARLDVDDLDVAPRRVVLALEIEARAVHA
jgi:hypothetical protein